MPVRSRRSLAALLALLLTLLVAESGRADPLESARQCLAALPVKVLGIVVLHDVTATEVAFKTAASQLGTPPLPVGTFVGNLLGADATGNLVVGLAESAEGTPVLFLMIPVDDFDEFVTGLEGIAGEQTEIQLAGQRLLAVRRGNWALLTSVGGSVAQETYAPTEALVEAAGPHFAPEQRGAISAIVPGDALRRAATLIGTSGKPPKELERLRRSFQLREMRWNQPGDWGDFLLAYGPLVEALAEHTEGVLIQGRGQENADLALSGTLLARDADARQPRETTAAHVGPLELPARQAFLTAAGPTITSWTPAGVELFLGHLASRTHDLGVAEFPPEEWNGFRQSVHALVGEIGSASLLAVAPGEDEPQLANQGVLLEVADAKRFLTSVQELTTDWNRLLENAQHEVELVFDAGPLEIAGLKGTRFVVDLPTAFQAAHVPEVRTVLTRLFGNNGEMRIDVLPLDAKRVLVSQFPPEITTELVSEIGKSNRTESTASEWTLEFAPQVYQDWQNTTFRASFEGNIVGWKPRRFSSDEKVRMTIEPTKGPLRIRSVLSAEVLGAWIDFIQRKPQP